MSLQFNSMQCTVKMRQPLDAVCSAPAVSCQNETWCHCATCGKPSVGRSFVRYHFARLVYKYDIFAVLGLCSLWVARTCKTVVASFHIALFLCRFSCPLLNIFHLGRSCASRIQFAATRLMPTFHSVQGRLIHMC